MATSVYLNQRGTLRIYDGSVTPRYLTIPWVQDDATFPLNRPRPEPVLRMDRRTHSPYTHFTPQGDESIATPTEVTFTIFFDNQLKDDVQAAMCNPFDLATWSVGISVFVTAAGTGASILNGAGSLVAVPQWTHDTTHRRVHVEFLWWGSPQGTRDSGFRHEECHFPRGRQQMRGAEVVSLSAVYQCFGAMVPITAHTAGTDVTPAII